MPAIGDGRERLFIGVPVPEKTGHSLLRQLAAELPGRPIAPGKWHFTLRFLGSTSPRIRDEVAEGLRAASLSSAFEVRFDGLGAFPSPQRARVLWIGITSGRDRLMALAAAADRIARQAGIPPEHRPFKPHLTISRIDPPQNLVPLIRSTVVRAGMRVDRVVLFRSRPGNPASPYEVVARTNLDAESESFSA